MIMSRGECLEERASKEVMGPTKVVVVVVVVERSPHPGRALVSSTTRFRYSAPSTCLP